MKPAKFFIRARVQLIIVVSFLLLCLIELPQHCVVPYVSLVSEDLFWLVAFCSEGHHEVVTAGRVFWSALYGGFVDIDHGIATLNKVVVLHGGECKRDRQDYERHDGTERALNYLFARYVEGRNWLTEDVYFLKEIQQSITLFAHF